MAEGGGESFGEWAAEWLATSIHIKPRTRIGYEGVLRRYLLPTFGDVPIDEITQRDVRRAVAAWSEMVSPGTVKTTFSVLRNVLLSAKASGLIHVNPCAGVRMPRSARSRRRCPATRC